jgi:hypothetical protein
VRDRRSRRLVNQTPSAGPVEGEARFGRLGWAALWSIGDALATFVTHK